MASFRVFKTTYKDRKGKVREASRWYVEFRDQLETVRRLPAFTSKAASEELGRNIVKLVGYFKGSGGQLDPSLTTWLATLPVNVVAKLVAIGLLNRERAAVAQPLAEHLADFANALKAKDCSGRHVDLVVSRARKIIVGCGFKYHNDIKASKVMAFLADLRLDKDGERGIGAQTFNFYMSAIKQFCRWLVKDRRAAESPVAHLDNSNVKTDRRHDRRALAVGELVDLLGTTTSGPDRHDLAGPDRAMLYRLAVETGLRAGELRSLTRASFTLEGDNPTVTVAAEYSKRRRLDTLPLRLALANELRSFLGTLAPAALVFRMPTRQHTIDMFRADVEAAGIACVIDGPSGPLFADFHSLRHTFITLLANGGVHPKVAQSLARHSTITLTMDRYSHTLIGEQSAALDALPDLSATARQAVRATGTDGQQAASAPNSPKTAPAVLACCLALSERLPETPIDNRGCDDGKADMGMSAQKNRSGRGEDASRAVDGSVWESNPLTAFFKPSAGFEDQGPHQRCKHSPRR